MGIVFQTTLVSPPGMYGPVLSEISMASMILARPYAPPFGFSRSGHSYSECAPGDEEKSPDALPGSVYFSKREILSALRAPRIACRAPIEYVKCSFAGEKKHCCQNTRANHNQPARGLRSRAWRAGRGRRARLVAGAAWRGRDRAGVGAARRAAVLRGSNPVASRCSRRPARCSGVS